MTTYRDCSGNEIEIPDEQPDAIRDRSGAETWNEPSAAEWIAKPAYILPLT